MSDGTTLGPVEIAVIGFPENKFTGEIAPAIADLVESGTVSILDLVFITKDEDGSVAGVELNELDEAVAAPYHELDGEAGGLLSDEDFEQIGEALDPNSSALAIVWENSGPASSSAPSRTPAACWSPTTASTRRPSRKCSPRTDLPRPPRDIVGGWPPSRSSAPRGSTPASTGRRLPSSTSRSTTVSSWSSSDHRVAASRRR